MMPAVESRAFRERFIKCRWIYDLFAVGYDHLERYLQLPAALDPMLERAGEAASAQGLAETIAEVDGAIPPVVWNYLNTPATELQCRVSYEFLLRLLCTLDAIDEVSEAINAFRSAPVIGDSFRSPRDFFELRQRLNTEDDEGLVLFRIDSIPESQRSWAGLSIERRQREIPRYRGQHLARRFQNLCRVPPISGCEIDYTILPARADVRAPREDPSLTIGIVPLVDDVVVSQSSCQLIPGPLVLRVLSEEPEKASCTYTVAGDGEEYGVEVGDTLCRVLSNRAETAIRVLQDADARIAVFPELVVPEAVVRRIQSTLRATYTGAAGLQLVVAGTYLRGRGPTRMPYNEAIVLSGRGDVLWNQRKMHQYEMFPYEQRRTGLDGFLRLRYAREAITTHPRKLVVRDSWQYGRIVILVCEDFAQPTPGLSALTSLQTNLVIAPVMAGELLRNRSFAIQAGRLAQEVGSICVVANSGAIARPEWRRWGSGDQPPALGIVALPLARANTGEMVEVLTVPIRAADGTEVLLFRCPAPVDGGQTTH